MILNKHTELKIERPMMELVPINHPLLLLTGEP